MTALHRRVRAASARLGDVDVRRPEEPASVRWLGVLRILLPALERLAAYGALPAEVEATAYVPVR